MRSKSWLRGNPSTLAKLSVIFLLLVVAAISWHFLQPDKSIVVGIFMGAALPIAVNLAISFLEHASEEKAIPAGFIAAAGSELSSASYYREKQEINITIKSNAGAEEIHIEMMADIIPFQTGARIYRQDITYVPPGLKKMVYSYKVAGVELSEDGFYPIERKVRDRVYIIYQITDIEQTKFEDTHSWPSPVLDYTVTFNGPERFDFKIGRIIAADEVESLSEEASRSAQNSKIFLGKRSAFINQSLKWTFKRL
ncbi:hypothetical protein VQH23_24220 [Pararoseomonas sp. SCSIO 73927]|uniref:hypothetical protein n=1 Tax=Pararoseomonas sp. SCSIO 73927 TaxID=3114537 RepID=UPI0030CED88B